jgi:hypothetical protein
VSRLRQRGPRLPTAGVRQAYASALRERWEGGPCWGHFGRIVARLEAGEPVVVPNWAIRKWVYVRGDASHVRLESDGTVTPVEPVPVGDVSIESV